MFADVLVLVLSGIAGLFLLLVVGLLVEARAAKRDGRSPAAVRQRPRFVRTLMNATMRRKRSKDAEPPSGPTPE